MAYTSDLRVKNLLTEIDMHVRKRLSDKNIIVDLEFRIFDESDEDAILWENGGLTFKDPNTKYEYGSNDCGWAIDNYPILIVEGTFGTERGQFGNGQLNRVSHPVGPAVNGYIGVLLEPYLGHSYVSKGSNNDCISKNIKYNNGKLNKELALAAIKYSEKSVGKFLIMDSYNPEELENLLYSLILKHLKHNNDSDIIINNVIKRMKDYLGNDYTFGKQSKQKLSKVYFTDGSIRSDACRYFSHNYESLTESSKRDGHGMFGKCLVELCMAKDKCTFIFIRMDNNDFSNLRKRNSKEFMFIDNNPYIDLYNYDDLFFTDKNLAKKIYDIRNQNLSSNSEKPLTAKIQDAFESGEIRIKK